MQKAQKPIRIFKKLIIFGAFSIMIMTFLTYFSENTNAASGNIVSKDLYKNIYDEIKNKPTEKSINKVSNEYGFSGEDTQNIVNGANLGPLINKYPDADQFSINSRFTEMREKYESELEIETLKSEIEMSMKPSEIYSDGDLSNSDFDLLVDLQIIEIILFKESEPSEFGGEFNLPSDVKSDIEDILAGIEEGDSDETGFETEDRTRRDKTLEEPGLLDAESSGNDEFNGLECLIEDNSLSDALDNYEESQDDESAEVGSDGTGADGDGTDGDEGEAIGDYDAKGEKDPLEAEGGDWTSTTLCPEGAPFCIYINFAITQANSYSPKSNCVACHVNMINKSMDKVLSYPLSANKVSGNLLEVPKCKTAISSLPLDMNIITVPVPAAQPTNTDLYKKSDIGGEWQRMLESVNLFLYNVGGEDAVQISIEPITIQTQSIKKALNNLSPDASISEFGQRSSNIASKQEQQLNDKAKKNELQNKGGDKNLYFQTIVNELNDMNRYFSTFKDKLEKMKTPCQRLKNKPSC